MEDSPLSETGAAAAFREVADEVLTLSGKLLSRTDCFGEDGAESVPLVEAAARSLVADFDAAVGPEPAGAFPADRDLRHEVGNYLQTIGGFTSLLLLESGLPEDVRDCLVRLDQNTKQLVSLLHA